MNKCNLTNESFFMTNDSLGTVIAEEADMYRLESPCRWCVKEVRAKCKEQLISIITGKKLIETPNMKDFINKYNKDDWDDEIQHWNQKGRIKHSKRSRK